PTPTCPVPFSSIFLPSALLYSLMLTAPTVIYTLSLHDALPICLFSFVHGNFPSGSRAIQRPFYRTWRPFARIYRGRTGTGKKGADRKSTRLNSSHVSISYAVFCLKKKNTKI